MRLFICSVFFSLLFAFAFCLGFCCYLFICVVLLVFSSAISTLSSPSSVFFSTGYLIVHLLKFHLFPFYIFSFLILFIFYFQSITTFIIGFCWSVCFLKSLFLIPVILTFQDVLLSFIAHIFLLSSDV